MSPGLLDIHTHIAGIGHGATGCYLHPRRMHGLVFRLLLSCLKISCKDLCRLDPLLLTRMRTVVREAPGVTVVVLALDWARDAGGGILRDLTDIHVPNDYVLNLARTESRILAGVSIHPLRADALEELERCRARGAVLVKWLPVSQNFSPADPCCLPFYARLSELGMPLLVHTGSEGATRNIDKAWNDPRLLIHALEAGVTVIAAHSGMRSLWHDRDYLDTWQAMLRDFSNLYGDTASVFGLRARSLARALNRELVPERLVHGSDWPIPASPWWFAGILPASCIRELARIPNPLTRDIMTKRALGLPEAVFERGFDLLRVERR